MLNKLINYFKNEEYSLLISPGKLYINNYHQVLDITNTSLKITVQSRKITILGEDLVIKKLDKRELLITGNIKKVEINE